MTLIMIAIGAAVGIWLRQTGRLAWLKPLSIYGALFVAGMLIEAAASGALIESVLTPGDLPVDRLVSMPLALVILVWLLGLLGVGIGLTGAVVYQRLRKPRPA